MKTRICLIDEKIQGVIKMNKKSILAIMLGLCFVFGFMGASAYGEVINVPDPAHVPPINTIQDAVNAANPLGGDTIMVNPGNYAGATIDRPVELIGSGTDQTFITSGVQYQCYPTSIGTVGFYIQTSEVSISNFNFKLAALAPGMVFGIAAFPHKLKLDNGTLVNGFIEKISISHNEFTGALLPDNSGQYSPNTLAIYMANCKGSSVTHNKINKCEYGVQIYSIGVSNGFTSNNNLVAFNDISAPNVKYGGIGIYVYSWYKRVYNASCAGRINLEAATYSDNKIVHNKLYCPDGGYGIYLVEQGGLTNPDRGRIINNNIGFNDFRGSSYEIVIWPTNTTTEVLTNNNFSRNLGYQDPNDQNRGEGNSETPPKEFNPQM